MIPLQQMVFCPKKFLIKTKQNTRSTELKSLSSLELYISLNVKWSCSPFPACFILTIQFEDFKRIQKMTLNILW